MNGLLAAPELTLHVLGAGAGLMAGLASSGHCALMCGPLACATIPQSRQARDPESLFTLKTPTARKEATRSALAYHGARIVSYAGVGAILGGVGQGARVVFSAAAPVLPWIMAGALIAGAAGVGKRLPVPSLLRRLATPVLRKTANFAPVARAAAIGASTPLLPCASLYALFLATIAAASAWGGGLLMAGFAVGASPAIALVQAHAPLLTRYPRATLWLRRAVPLVAAAILIWRATHAGSTTAPPTCH
ncbi:MAG TPA: sulfite exporter TauE/SafE family protein [Polyangia bacterium]